MIALLLGILLLTVRVCFCVCCMQLVFAVVSPGAVLPNLVAGAIAEAGAQQAGDLMQVMPSLTVFLSFSHTFTPTPAGSCAWDVGCACHC